MQLQKVAFKAVDETGPVYQMLHSFTDQLTAAVSNQLKVFTHNSPLTITLVPDLLFPYPAAARFCRILIANPAGAGLFFIVATT